MATLTKEQDVVRIKTTGNIARVHSKEVDVRLDGSFKAITGLPLASRAFNSVEAGCLAMTASMDDSTVSVFAFSGSHSAGTAAG